MSEPAAFDARRADQDTRLVTLDEVQGLTVRWPSAVDRESRVLDVLQEEFGSTLQVVALDRLETVRATSKDAGWGGCGMRWPGHLRTSPSLGRAAGGMRGRQR